MNRNKVYAKSKENQIIIKALNMYGRIPETWELLEEIERLNNIIKEVREYIKNHREAVDERAGHIIYILKDDFDEEDILKILDKVGSDKE